MRTTFRAFLGAVPVALALAVPAAPATDPAARQEPAVETSARPPDADTERRILHLRGGTSVRGLTRRTADGWELKDGARWRPLPEMAVERAVLEADARAELRALEKTAGDDPRAEAEVGGWALDNGLLEEGIETLDAVLAEHSDQPEARAALGRNAHRFSVPSVDPTGADLHRATDELVRWAGRRGPSSRELAVLELAGVRDRSVLEEHLTRELFAQTPRRRAFAAHALRRIVPGHALKPLLHRAVLDGSDEVRLDASHALRDAGNVGVIVPAVKALESQHPKVRKQAAEALGNMGYPAAVEPLVTRLAAVQGGGHNVPHSYIFAGRQFAYIQDFDVEVAQFQAVADPQVNVLVEGMVLEAGVHGVKDVHYAAESRAIRTSLGQLTGENPGRTSKAWLEWWEENGSRWRAEAMADVAPR